MIRAKNNASQQTEFLPIFIGICVLGGFIYFLSTLSVGQRIFVFIIIIGFLVFLGLRKEYIENKQEKLLDLDDHYGVIQRMREITPKCFEDLMAYFFKKRGYAIVKQSKRRNSGGTWKPLADQGIDLIVEKDGIRTFIQIKKYFTKQVSVEVSRAFYGAIVDELKPGDSGMIITTSIFSRDSELFCDSKGIAMVDYQGLLKQVDYLKQDYRDALTEYFMTLESSSPKVKEYVRTCPKCYAPVIRRKGPFYSCMNHFVTGCNYSFVYKKSSKELPSSSDTTTYHSYFPRKAYLQKH